MITITNEDNMVLMSRYEDNYFDGILCSEGIEHIDNQIFLLREFYRILKPEGILIVTTPNILNLEGRLGLLLSGHAHRRRAMVISTAAVRAQSKATLPPPSTKTLRSERFGPLPSRTSRR